MKIIEVKDYNIKQEAFMDDVKTANNKGKSIEIIGEAYEKVKGQEPWRLICKGHFQS